MIRPYVMKKESVGQRGKTAEEIAKAHLDKLNTQHANFAYVRTSDARAAGGRLKKQLSDYLCWWSNAGHINLNVPLEVKSTMHDYRLGKDAISQLPLLHKVAKAGAKPYVAVMFKKTGQWRIAPISFFEFGVPSWDMRELYPYDCLEDALNSTGAFPPLRPFRE